MHDFQKRNFISREQIPVLTNGGLRRFLYDALLMNVMYDERRITLAIVTQRGMKIKRRNNTIRPWIQSRDFRIYIKTSVLIFMSNKMKLKQLYLKLWVRARRRWAEQGYKAYILSIKKVVLQKGTVTQLVKKKSPPMEPVCSLPSATGPYPVPDEFSPHSSQFIFIIWPSYKMQSVHDVRFPKYEV
jgi:hypothetical protein